MLCIGFGLISISMDSEPPGFRSARRAASAWPAGYRLLLSPPTPSALGRTMIRSPQDAKRFATKRLPAG
jgi:hypothetical protein